MRRRALFVSLVLLVTAVAPATAPAQTAGDPYAADPHRLVPFADTVQRVYTTGTDTWDVWVCRTPGWPAIVSLADAVNGLNANITPYFDWLSSTKYRPVFRAGGTVSSGDVITADLGGAEQQFASGCETAVAAASTASPNGVVIIVDTPFDEGYATAGTVCPEPPFSGCTTTYPANFRVAVLGAATVKTVSGFAAPQWITAAHEIGHTLNWAHSYGGLNTIPSLDKYDNPMDMMSGAIHRGQPVGTLAYNRYAAGWISSADVVLHTDGIAVITVNGVGTAGTQMIALPSSDSRRFFFLGVRRRTSYDAALPKSGIEIYQADQRGGEACALPASWPTTWPCFATFMRIKQTPATTGQAGTAHVLGIDETAVLEKWDVQVLSAGANSFTVRISERDSGRFIDDDGNIHEANIETIAALGITQGCNPPLNDKYCPSQSVTRAEVAVFILAAKGEQPLTTYQGYFLDVPEGAWYTPYVEKLFDLGYTKGFDDGTYHPGGTLKRSEMAAFLVSAFGTVPPEPATPGFFTDMTASDWFAPYAEQLFDLGITSGCNAVPLKYCPSGVVKRDQMATFLAKAVALP